MALVRVPFYFLNLLPTSILYNLYYFRVGIGVVTWCWNGWSFGRDWVCV